MTTKELLKQRFEEKFGKGIPQVFEIDDNLFDFISSECRRAKGEGFKLGQESMAGVVAEEISKYLASLTHTKL